MTANRTNGITVPKIADATPNPPREALDLYTPRFVRGKGTTKVRRRYSTWHGLSLKGVVQVGLCPICHESQARGGEGKKVWLSMKFSAFKWCVVFSGPSPPLAHVRPKQSTPIQCLFTPLLTNETATTCNMHTVCACPRLLLPP